MHLLGRKQAPSLSSGGPIPCACLLGGVNPALLAWDRQTSLSLCKVRSNTTRFCWNISALIKCVNYIKYKASNSPPSCALNQYFASQFFLAQRIQIKPDDDHRVNRVLFCLLSVPGGDPLLSLQQFHPKIPPPQKTPPDLLTDGEPRWGCVCVSGHF